MTETGPPIIFNRRRVRAARTRAFRNAVNRPFLHQRVVEDVVDRLETTMRPFERAVFFGVGVPRDFLTPDCGVGHALYTDFHTAAAGDALDIVVDEERWPFAPESLDLIVSVLSLHHANDLVGALSQMRASLRPDGLLIAAMLGEATLSSLRAALYEAEDALCGGVAPRVAPFASVRDLGGALQRAGFAMPVCDLDTVNVRYSDPRRLFADLRDGAFANALARRGPPLRRDVAAASLARLAASDAPIVFDIVYLTGWAPSPDQQKPARRGSATASLAEAVTRATDN
ncbi:MAG: methyltransferase domain-containing protein [Pseudomonadota bacterium]